VSDIRVRPRSSAFNFQRYEKKGCAMRAANRFPTSVRLLALLALLALTLFPFGWLGTLWPTFGRGLDQVFSTDGWHAIGHAALFCLLGIAALAVLPQLRTRPGHYFGMLLMVGVGQEIFQILYKGRRLLFDDGRDLLTDLVGLLVAFAVMWCWRKLRSKKYF
jgi:hypothetical protein